MFSHVLKSLFVFSLLAGSVLAEYTYPQAQIGQAQMLAPPGPVNLGDGSVQTKDQAIVASAVLFNVTTGDVIDIVLPSDLLTTKVSGGSTYRMYKVQHSPAVAGDDEILLLIDGVPEAAFRVRTYVLFGTVRMWDLFKITDL